MAFLSISTYPSAASASLDVSWELTWTNGFGPNQMSGDSIIEFELDAVATITQVAGGTNSIAAETWTSPNGHWKISQNEMTTFGMFAGATMQHLSAPHPDDGEEAPADTKVFGGASYLDFGFQTTGVVEHEFSDPPHFDQYFIQGEYNGSLTDWPAIGGDPMILTMNYVGSHTVPEMPIGSGLAVLGMISGSAFWLRRRTIKV